MAIGTPLSLGTKRTGAVTSQTITTVNSSPSGALITVFASIQSGGVPYIGCTDSAGNTYTAAGSVQNFGSAGQVQIFVCENAAALASSGTITVTWTNAVKGVIGACSTTGIATSSSQDQYTSPVIAVPPPDPTTITTNTTGTLAQADEVAFNVTCPWDRVSGWTPGSGFTALLNSGGDADTELYVDYKITAATTALNSSPSWTNINTPMRVGTTLITFKGASAPAASAVVSTLSMMGVG